MEYKVVIIGGGPAGYVAAIRAGQLGMKVALIEKEKLGGMCLNWGCIPTKALMESAKLFKRIKSASTFGITGINKSELVFDFKKAVARAKRISDKLNKGVEYLLKKNKVEIINGIGTIKNQNAVSVNDRLLETENIIISTGSRPEKKWKFKNDKIVEIDEMLNIEEIPEKIGFYGEGPHIVELAQMFAMTGKKVNFYNSSEKMVDFLDSNLEDFLAKKLKKDKVKVFYDCKFEEENGEIIVNGEKSVDDLIVNCSKRAGIIPKSEVEIENEFNFVKVDENFKTNFENIFAIGDVNGKSILAHAASAQGLFVINKLNGINKEFDCNKIPFNIYTTPEIAVIGKTEAQLKNENINFKTGEFALTANGKALTEGNTDGFVRIFSETEYGEVLGVQVVAENATDMIAEASVMLEIEGTVYDLANIVHAHPTVSEIFMEAGADSFNESIHK